MSSNTWQFFSQTKKFLTKDAVILPVSVQDDKKRDGSHTLFARMSHFPTKKVFECCKS